MNPSFAAFAACLTFAAGSAAAAPSVLMLHGGLVGADHPYFQLAARTLDEASVAHADGALGGPLDDGGDVRAVVVADYGAYRALDEAHAAELAAYCRRRGAGMFFLYVDAGAELAEAGAVAGGHEAVGRIATAAASPVLSLLRDGVEGTVAVPGFARHFRGGTGDAAIAEGGDALLLAKDDGVRRVWNGLDLLDHWLVKLAFLDGLRWVSHDAVAPAAERWLAVDIDDIFQPSYAADPRARTVKIQAGDVDELLAFSDEMSALTGDTFRFSLGFNADYYGLAVGPSPYDDRKGDEALVANAARFTWFDHLPAHEPATSLEQLQLEALMRQSKRWAEDHGVLQYVGAYGVAPYHDGMVPPYQPLYLAWRAIWGLETAGAMYAGGAFRHEGIAVMSRLDCGAPCDSSVYGFDQIARADVVAAADRYIVTRMASQPVTILMSHQSDYARDRVGMVALRAAVAEIREFTRLQMRTGSPDALVRRFVERFGAGAG